MVLVSADDVFTCSTMLVDTLVTVDAMPSPNPVAKRGRVAQELESILELLTEIHENPAGGLDSLNPRGLQGPGTFAECLRGRLLEGKRRGESIDGAGC